MTAISHLLNTIVEVRRREVTPDDMGGQVVEWQTVGSEPARVSSPATSTTAATISAQQSLEKVPYYVYLQPSADIRRGDVLVDGSDGREMWVDAISRPSVHSYNRAAVRDWQAEPTVEA